LWIGARGYRRAGRLKGFVGVQELLQRLHLARDAGAVQRLCLGAPGVGGPSVRVTRGTTRPTHSPAFSRHAPYSMNRRAKPVPMRRFSRNEYTASGRFTRLAYSSHRSMQRGSLWSSVRSLSESVAVRRNSYNVCLSFGKCAARNVAYASSGPSGSTASNAPSAARCSRARSAARSTGIGVITVERAAGLRRRTR
jgi:hypothetical protein